jgi:hypothetical protein
LARQGKRKRREEKGRREHGMMDGCIAYLDTSGLYAHAAAAFVLDSTFAPRSIGRVVGEGCQDAT